MGPRVPLVKTALVSALWCATTHITSQSFMVMVIHSALVWSHQSTSVNNLISSASCVPRGYKTYNTRAQPCLKMWRGTPDGPPRSARRPTPASPILCTLAASPEGVDVVL